MLSRTNNNLIQIFQPFPILQNGLHICQSCGSCCSHAMFKRKIENLETTCGIIHPDLRSKVENSEGHLECAEYYCHSCGEMMTDAGDEKFECLNCNVIYETKQYKIERNLQFKRRKDYPVRYNYTEVDEP